MSNARSRTGRRGAGASERGHTPSMTDLPRADQQAWEGELFHLLVENVTDYAIFVIDAQRCVRSWGAGAERMLGYRDAEVLGTTTDRFFLPEDLQANAPQREIEQALATGRGEDERWHVRKDGSRFWASGVLTPLREPSGTLRGFAKILRDRTANKRAELDVRFLASASASLAALVDPESTLRTVAGLAVPFFADWCAVDLAEPGGGLRRLAVAHVDPAKVQLAVETHRRFPPDPEATHGVANVLRTGKAELVSEITDEMLVQSARAPDLLHLLRTLGLRSYMSVPLLVRGRPIGVFTFIAAESGRRYGPADLALAEDLLRRAAVAIENARLYSEVRDSDRRKDIFLATLAHELRNPLAPIRNAVQVLRLPGASEAQRQRAIDIVERQGRQLTRLVEDLLDVSRVGRGKLPLRLEDVDLAAIAARAVETARPLMDERQHHLSVMLPPEPLLLRADPVRLEQIITNLLRNAAKYTEPGGQITLSAACEGAWAVLRVRDNGVGIAPAFLPHLFDIFAQAAEHAEQSGGGLGIGLALVRSLTELHGGTVEAHSDGPGTGSEFVVRLPLATPGSAAPATADVAAAEPTAPLRRVLVVDDNIDAAESLALMLRLRGHTVWVAFDGAAALELTRDHNPDVFLLDLGLPGVDGFELARQLRARPESARALFVALTGWGQDADRDRSREAGFDVHLTKPVDPDALLALLARPPAVVTSA